jgi:hypothetical protein
LGEFLLANATFFVLVVLLFAAVNWGEFRTNLFAALRTIARGLGHLFVDAPRWIAGRPLVQALVNSRAARFAGRFVVKPLAIAAAVVLFTPHRAGSDMRWVVFGAVFASANFIINSRAGRAIEQVVFHWLRVLGAHVTSDILGNLFSGISHFFARRLEDFDRMLYAVDEWLRFRHGQPGISLALKAAMGVFWFYLAYFARFAVNLLVEPQINPIKHFPVVTVSHKIIFPTVGLIVQAIKQLGISTVRARTLAVCIVTTIPGVFGFLAWELRSNWKLYRANRAPMLKPIPIGSHGETMARLLRPGFHSGTVPKIFARLRRAQMNQTAGSAIPPAQTEAREHVAQAVSHFIEREFTFRLNQHPTWTQSPIALARVRLGPTRISIDLTCPVLDPRPAEIFFEQRAGWILAGIENPAWIAGLDPARSPFFFAALLGLYKIAGVEIVKEQIEHQFGARPVAFDLSREELIVWPDQKFGLASRYPLAEVEGVDHSNSASPRGFLLKFISIDWDDWVKIWDPLSGDGFEAPRCMAQVLPAVARLSD